MNTQQDNQQNRNTSLTTHSSTSTNGLAIDIVSLYFNDMNIYGDTGNLLILARRLTLSGFEPVIHPYNPGDAWPEHADIILGGGGQDSGQRRIQDDLRDRAPLLRDLSAQGIPMLMICGMYQLFGKSFETIDGDIIPGIGVFDAVTIGKSERLVGNIVEDSPKFGVLVGYENHSGQTYLSGETTPLGKVTSGVGNNADDTSEGAIAHNVIGTYLHGPILSKNPGVADFLIRTAVANRYGDDVFKTVQEDRTALDELNATAARAREAAIERPR